MKEKEIWNWRRRSEEWSWDAVVALATQTEGDQKLKEGLSFHQNNV